MTPSRFLSSLSLPDACASVTVRGRLRASGFTMVELITVIVLVGILASIGVARFADRRAFDSVQFADQGRAMLRYAQKTAIAQGRPVFVRLDGTSLALCFDAACAQRVLPPSGSNSGSAVTIARCAGVSAWFCEGLPAGLTYALQPAASYTAPTSFFFDPVGRPYRAADAWPAGNSTFVNLTIRISGDGTNHDIIVEQETGYVH